MSILFGILAAFMIISGVVLLVLRAFWFKSSRYDDEARIAQKKQNKKSFLSWATFLIIAGIAITVVINTITVVPTGYTGVRTTFGQISTQPVPQGFNAKIPFVQGIHLVNNKQQDGVINGQIWGETTEKTPVYADGVTVSYCVLPEKSAWIYANVANADKGLITEPLVASAVKDAMASMSTTEVTVRGNIEPLVCQLLNESLTNKYGEGVVSVKKVTISQMDFEESFNKAISEKSIAIEMQKAQAIQNQTNIDAAEANKKIAITKAEEEAEGERIRMEGHAKARLIEAEAEAEVNRKLEESLTDKVLTSKFYNKWNGNLPQVMGEGTVITNVGR